MILKSIPSDFKVKEIMKLELEEGPYSYYLLTKKNWNTMAVIKKLSQILKTKRIGFAGNKDKNAITEQYISFNRISKERIEKVNIKDVSLKYIGTGNKKIFLGSLESNSFEIIVRDIEKNFTGKDFMPNYFGEQRFGTNDDNADIGKALIKKKFKEACSILKLEVIKNNYLGALQEHGEDMLKFYIHAYQSKLFNECLKEYLGEEFPNKEVKNVKIPILSFDTEFEGKIGKIYEEILEKEGIILRDFVIKQLPRTLSQGENRDAIVKVKELKIGKLLDDELNEGKKKQKLSFILPKGSYATVYIKSLESK